MGIPLALDDFDRLSQGIPLLANLHPSGSYFMEDFYYAGGLPALIKVMSHQLNNTLTVNGKGLVDNCQLAERYNDDVISAFDQPFKPHSGIAVVKGNLCPNGAVMKPSAATPTLMVHRGRAVVFENIDDYKARIDDPDLDIDETCVMVLKQVGPKGYPGMPEVGNMGLPKKLLEKGVKDMVRISDGRMSGTGFGTVLLHASPEAAAGGNLALVQNGDFIALDVPNRRIHLEVSDDELARRRAVWQEPASEYDRGYVQLYIQHVNQAHEGADLDFLRGSSGSVVKRDSH